ncbi:death-associated inhibitor of apoptosis 1 [Toxorhynchites rutilus septentrionalis]|uniref:death-associated inhibitor of apoptosis 1 n=1 Tax=Toxorhynchites rutilus septentrionalis TaxID=329112 RepID=UPI002478BD2E|nr:death-associated inhibitor of apoptosis 1 [Toxorhynchites rutilus septentrionalis]XP_055625208.1 death-associated inhibitor of apoptosis 1 [Toxorhynchites rutilus septentrionalis]
MTAQVQSMPRDYTDNKVKDESPYGLTTGASLSYHMEVSRLESFRNWSVPFISKIELARYGFYFVGPNDMVKCYFCRVEIGLWEPNDNVLSEHLRWSPYCPLLRKRQTNNVPIDGCFLDQLPEPSYDTCGIRIREHSVAENGYSSSDRSSNGSMTSPPSSLTSESSMMSHASADELQQQQSLFEHHQQHQQQHKLPEYPNYAIEAKRFQSYEDWPKFMKQKPKELSDAGFFYTGKSDRVKCFSCGGGLKDWEAEDEPWEQHAMWYSNCEYLKLMKGEEYIAQCLEKKENPPAAVEQPQSSVSAGTSSCSPQPSISGASSPAAATTALTSASVLQLSPSSLSSSLMEDVKPSGMSVCNGHSPSSSVSSSSGLEEDEDEPNRKSDTNRTCKICYVNEYNTAFSPCGHVVACAKCASSVTKCPLCRKPFTNVMRIYLM